MTALCIQALLPNCTVSKMLQPRRKLSLLPSKSSCVPCATQCVASTIVHEDETRRSAHYEPTIWHYDYIQSLRSEYMGESYAQQRDQLKEEVRVMLCKVANPVDQLELTDTLQRLGVAYHFSNEISNILEKVYNINKDTLERNKKDLYATALEFRLLRQHGYDVSTEVFKGFQDEDGNFNICHSFDIKDMLSLYEASFHSMEDETILDEARDFSSKYLKEFLNKNKDTEMSLRVSHALELPLHWRMPRLDAWRSIDVYEKRHDMNPALLKLAILDFNIIQGIHQDDLKHASRWWKRIGVGERLTFARDRLMESFFWTVGFAFQPHMGYFRRVMTKVNALITTIDDIYDAYGTLEELELFTEVVDRWDVNAAHTLPNYMKIGFLALSNFVNELALDTLKEKDYFIIPYLKKAWGDLCKTYLVEAKWYYSRYRPSLQEYMENAWISIGAPTILVHAYLLTASTIKEEDLDSIKAYPNIIRSSSIIFRLVDDLGTYKREMEMGDVPKSIECYMKETGASEADACEHIKSMIHTTWKKMNEEAHDSPFSKSFKEIAMNAGRMALCMYEHGDGHSDHDPETMNRILSLIIQPIPFVASNIRSLTQYH